MQNAYIVKVEGDYSLDVYLVFAENEKEAKTRVYNHSGKTWKNETREVLMNVVAEYNGEDVVHLAGYWE